MAQCMALRPADMLFPTRTAIRALQIVRGIALVDLEWQLLSNTRDMCKGRQLPVMYHSKAGNIFSISGNLATQFPRRWAGPWPPPSRARIIWRRAGSGRAAPQRPFPSGTALCLRVSSAGHSERSEQSVGDLHFSGLCRWRAHSFAARGPGYGVAGLRCDGNDFLAVHAATQWAEERARTEEGTH